MKYDMEKIRGGIMGSVTAQIICLCAGTDKREASTAIMGVLVPQLKECGIDFEEDPKNLFDFIMYLQENNQGLYLLFKTLTSNFLMANPKNWDNSIFLKKYLE